jgi:glutamine amidotransferase-like uncharacterized protein
MNRENFMLTVRLVPILLINLLIIASGLAQTEGYYKDLFMDGGVELTSKTTLPAADALNLDMEFIATEDANLQNQILIANIHDQNGFLLYPDNAPRFRMIYTNGGAATNHGNSLGDEGRSRIRTFYYNGGSYSGSCAGAYIASLSYFANGVHEPYYHIWPGRTEPTNLTQTNTGHFIPEDSPLLDYFDFDGDNYISSIYHNSGCFARENIDFPSGTEILLRYDYPSLPMHEKASCWAYKDDETTGRIVVIGSHPESATSGERLQLMAVILLYALDGSAVPQIKASLTNGQTRHMTKSTSENDPAFTKIGDKQYHHFTVEIPENAKDFNLVLTGSDEYDLYLYLNKDHIAFEGDARYELKKAGINKTFTLPDISAGTWYIGVKCATTVKTEKESWGYLYSGQLEVLNGIAYTITASWNTTSTGIAHSAELPVEHELLQNYPNPFNPVTNIEFLISKSEFVTLKVYNALGEEIAELVSGQLNQGQYIYKFDGRNLASGVYYYQLTAGACREVRKMMLLR